jgi:hypothetical protein
MKILIRVEPNERIMERRVARERVATKGEANMTTMRVDFNDNEVSLLNFQEQVIISFRLGAGNVFVQGKVNAVNNDGDFQNYTARLTYRDGSVELDRADVRISGGGTQTVSLSSWITDVTANDIVDLRCGTYNGITRKARLTTLDVDTFEPH